MACTTILVGKAASYDGSTMIARNDDSGSGHFTAKNSWWSTRRNCPNLPLRASHVEIALPVAPCGLPPCPTPWRARASGRAGVNAANVGMTATETITSNPRVLGADPLVEYQPAKDGKPRCPAASARRISSIWCCPTSTPPARACCVWEAAGEIRYLRDERHCFPGRERNLVAGDHRRPSLDGTPCAR